MVAYKNEHIVTRWPHKNAQKLPEPDVTGRNVMGRNFEHRANAPKYDTTGRPIKGRNSLREVVKKEIIYG